jgi:type I restriction enzyme S subunit
MDSPPNWTVAQTAELLVHDIGGVWGKEPGVEAVDVSVVRVADFRDNGSVSLESAPLRSVTRKQLDSRRLVPGDILLEKSGGGPNKPVGRVARVQGGSSPVVPTNFAQLLRPNGRVVDSAFLFWWLWYSHLSGQSAAFQRATTNIRNLQTQDYLGRATPVAPLNEQRRIVAAIEEHLSRLDAAEQSLRATRARLSALTELLDSELVRGWETKRLDQVCPVFVDCPHRTPKYEAEGIPALRPRDVVGGALRLDTAARVGRPEFELQTKRRVPVEGDVVYSRELSYGWAALIPPNAEFCLSQGMVLFRPDESLLPEFLVLVLNGSRGREQARRAATGSAHPHINLRDIRAYEIPVPPLEVQEAIVQRIQMEVSAIDALRAAVERAQRRSASLRRAVLERAFRGELVPQDPWDEPASVLLERIRAERAAAPPPSRRRKATA